MFSKSIHCGAIAICLGALPIVFAEETSAASKLKSEFEGVAETVPPKKIDWEKRATFGSKGNITVYVDKDGAPTEIYVVGVAAIPQTMDPVEAEEEAREDAEFNAKAAFALWIAEKFTVKTVRDKKVLVVRKNKEEQSESVSISKRHAEQIASAAWRGMSVFWQKQTKRRYIAVWRWSASGQKQAKLVERLTSDNNSVSPISPASSTPLDNNSNVEIREIEGTFR